MNKIRVAEQQALQGKLLDQLYGDISPELRAELNQQYEATVKALVEELTDFAPCGDVDAGLYELFHSVKDESFHRGACYEFVKIWVRNPNCTDIRI
jgi:hypothetical protein